MLKIKISTIILLTIFGLNAVLFLDSDTFWPVMATGVLTLCLIVYLSVNARKVGGIIKKLVMWFDVLVVLISVSLAIIPTGSNMYFLSKVPLALMLLASAGFLIAILVNAYKPQELK